MQLEPLPTKCSIGEVIDFLYDRCESTDIQTEFLNFLDEAIYTDAELEMEPRPDKQMYIRASAVTSPLIDGTGSDQGYQIWAGAGASPQQLHDIDPARQARFLVVRNGKIVGVAKVQRLNS